METQECLMNHGVHGRKQVYHAQQALNAPRLSFQHLDGV